jgi:hypothetical protein
MSETYPWERLPNETNRWYQRFEAFRLLGPERSLLGAVNRERVKKSQKESNSLPGSWRAAAKTYRWKKRAEAWDMFVAREAARQAEEERMAVMAEGFALDYVRVRALKKLATKLDEEIGEPNKEWLPDVKSIGSGEFAERVDLVRFNAPLIEQFRGTLADIADETGGRQKTGRNLNIDLSGLNDDQLKRIAAGEDPIKVLASASS